MNGATKLSRDPRANVAERLPYASHCVAGSCVTPLPRIATPEQLGMECRQLHTSANRNGEPDLTKHKQAPRALQQLCEIDRAEWQATAAVCKDKPLVDRRVMPVPVRSDLIGRYRNWLVLTGPISPRPPHSVLRVALLMRRAPQRSAVRATSAEAIECFFPRGCRTYVRSSRIRFKAAEFWRVYQ
jgi:hypothetical protein